MTDISSERIERIITILEHHGVSDSECIARDILTFLSSVIEGARAEERDTELLVAGWNACRKSVYAVCESVINENEKHRDDQENAIRHHFGRGGMSAAKSIARGFNSMEALDDDNLSILIRSRTPVAAEADKGLSLPNDMTPAIEDALSFMLWHSASLSMIYRRAGFDIPHKAEKEQAFVLWKNLRAAVQHGDKWREAAQAELNALCDRAASPSISSEGV